MPSWSLSVSDQNKKTENYKVHLSTVKVLRNAKKNGTFPVEMIRNMTLESESDSSDESDDLDDSSDESESSSSSDEGDEITVTQHRTKRSRTGY